MTPEFLTATRIVGTVQFVNSTMVLPLWVKLMQNCIVTFVVDVVIFVYLYSVPKKETLFFPRFILSIKRCMALYFNMTMPDPTQHAAPSLSSQETSNYPLAFHVSRFKPNTLRMSWTGVFTAKWTPMQMCMFPSGKISLGWEVLKPLTLTRISCKMKFDDLILLLIFLTSIQFWNKSVFLYIWTVEFSKW